MIDDIHVTIDIYADVHKQSTLLKFLDLQLLLYAIPMAFIIINYFFEIHGSSWYIE